MGYRMLSKTLVYEQDKWFPSCHASTVCRPREGGYLCACFGGTMESSEDTAIWLARSEDGVSFAAPKKIRALDTPHWNPVLDVTDTGCALYFKTGVSIDAWKTYVCFSDDGIAWSEPEELVPGDFSGGRGPTKNPMLRWNGMLIAGRSVESRTALTVENDVSFDGGKTWHSAQPLDYIYDEIMAQSYRTKKQNGLIQPTLWADEEGVHMFMRSNWGAVYRSDSTDGLKWSPAYRTGIPNNSSGICAAYKDGILALCYNPVSSLECSNSLRTPLVMDFSKDGGKSFFDRVVLDDGPGEFSYPTVVPDEGGFTVSYTWKRKTIALARVVSD